MVTYRTGTTSSWCTRPPCTHAYVRRPQKNVRRVVRSTSIDGGTEPSYTPTRTLDRHSHRDHAATTPLGHASSTAAGPPAAAYPAGARPPRTSAAPWVAPRSTTHHRRGRRCCGCFGDVRRHRWRRRCCCALPSTRPHAARHWGMHWCGCHVVRRRRRRHRRRRRRHPARALRRRRATRRAASSV